MQARTRRTPQDHSRAESAARYDDLKKMLMARQRELMAELKGRLRTVRDEGPEQERGGLNPDEAADVAVQDDVEFALMQMKAESAKKISDALARVDEGTYGRCLECGEEIAQPRLRALPFAARCKCCEEAVEMSHECDRARARRAAAVFGIEITR